MSKGTLYLIPVPITSENSSCYNPHEALIHRLQIYIVENEKTARHWLKFFGKKLSLTELRLHEYAKHSDKKNLALYFNELEAGEDVGLMSEAGCPAIADPGSDLILEAHRRSIPVRPLVGPSAIILALMASGFNGQSFAFHGYLPIHRGQRIAKLKELEAHSRRTRQTQIFIETPFRNEQLLKDILRSCHPKTNLCIACNLTAANEEIIATTIAEWKFKLPNVHKKPAIFLLYAT